MISFVIPSKEEPRILELVMELEEMIPGCEIIIANDRYGKGKGWAVREAFHESKFDYVCFIDGDMDIHPRMIWRLLPFMTDYDVVVGRKQIRGIMSRRILTRLSRLWIRMLFGLGIDTQTGLKMFRVHTIMPWETDGFLYDVEILYKAKLAGHEIIEVPVEANIEKRMKASSVYRTFLESLELWVRFMKLVWGTKGECNVYCKDQGADLERQAMGPIWKEMRRDRRKRSQAG